MLDFLTIGNESAPIQLAQCRFPGLAISSSRILIYFSNKICGTVLSNSTLVWNYQHVDCSFQERHFYCVVYYNFRHTFVPYRSRINAARICRTAAAATDRYLLLVRARPQQQTRRPLLLLSAVDRWNRQMERHIGLDTHTHTTATELSPWLGETIDRESGFYECNFFNSWILVIFKHVHWILSWNSKL